MKRILKILLFVLCPFFVNAQQYIDTLKSNLANASGDSARYFASFILYNYYEESNRDSALLYAEEELVLARRNNKKLTEVISLNHKGYQLLGMGRYAESLNTLLQAFKIAEDPKNTEDKTWLRNPPAFKGDKRLYVLAYTHHIFALLMWQTQNQVQDIVHFKEARRISIQIGHKIRQMMAAMNLGRSYVNQGKLDSALFFTKEAEELANLTGFKKYLGQIYQIIGQVYFIKGDKTETLKYDHLAVNTSLEQYNLNALSAAYFLLTKDYLAEKQKDSALKYALRTVRVYKSLGPAMGMAVNLGTVYQNLYLSYELNNQFDSAYKYQGLALHTLDSLSRRRIKNLADFQNVNLNEQLRLQNIEKEKVVYQNKVRTWFLLGGIGILILLAIIFYRNNRQKHKANLKIEKAYSDLQATQKQLVQSEKMASLGELTAGIAHEIQNPLNFVNNFSDLNIELLEELKGERLKAEGKRNAGIEDELLNDISLNLEKINHHGKRADAIVKGMLQHSRSSTGKKEPAEINALADEYLRLSYHGLRAKDKLFNADINTDFDESIGEIKIIPQDIGRVLLNLYNNAFYSVNEKKKLQGENFNPTVEVITKRKGDKVEIIVKDNGTGIPPKVIDKIYQPFFTTKPTGQGTGLGLSMSYDIVKAHGGEIKVETTENEGSKFIIQLPIT